MLARYRVLWYWEAYINAILLGEYVFDKLICIRKSRRCYIAYFTVNDPEIYGQIIVIFTRRSFNTSEPIFWNRKGPLMMKYLYEGDSFIFDNRHEFDWIVGDKN